jgi:hypothetical protein
MKRVFLAACAIAASLIVATAAQGGVVEHDFNIPTNETIEACNGEIVDLTGTTDVLVTTTTTPDGRIEEHQHLTQHLTGIGETTGAKYEIHENTNFSDTPDFGNGAGEENLVFTVHSEAQGQVPDFSFQELLHSTFTPDGTVTGVHLSVVSGCSS